MSRECTCLFSTAGIIEPSFSCRLSKTSLVYRAKIAIPDSIAIASEIINDIMAWVLSHPSITVNKIILDIDPNCPVMLDSVDSDDCKPSSTSSMNGAALSAGELTGVSVTAVVIIIAVVVFTIILVIVGCNHRQKSRSHYR